MGARSRFESEWDKQTYTGGKLITSFYGVFDGKLAKLKEKLKEELKLSKDKRDRKFIREVLKEARSLKHTLKKIGGGKNKICCPKCDHEFVA